MPVAFNHTIVHARDASESATQHYAFLVTEDDFDQIYGRIVARGIEHYPAPRMDRKNEINHNDGGRGVYWCDPSGHFLEILTVPYGGWPADVERTP